MAAHPELISTDILVAGDQQQRGIQVDDRRQLFHLKALGIDPANGVLIGHNPAKIQLKRIEVEFGWHLQVLERTQPTTSAIWLRLVSNTSGRPAGSRSCS